MPSLRLLFFRLLPKTLGRKQHGDAKHCIGNGHRHHTLSVATQASMKGIAPSTKITVQYANHLRENDEMELGERERGCKPALNSSQVSQVSNGSYLV
jgi:hypothetical protein